MKAACPQDHPSLPYNPATDKLSTISFSVPSGLERELAIYSHLHFICPIQIALEGWGGVGEVSGGVALPCNRCLFSGGGVLVLHHLEVLCLGQPAFSSLSLMHGNLCFRGGGGRNPPVIKNGGRRRGISSPSSPPPFHYTLLYVTKNKWV